VAAATALDLTTEGRLELLSNQLAQLTGRQRDSALTMAADRYARWKVGPKASRGPIPDVLSVVEEAVRYAAGS
jgi:hypothetical protein